MFPRSKAQSRGAARLFDVPQHRPEFVAEAEARAAEVAPLLASVLASTVTACSGMPRGMPRGVAPKSSPAAGTPLARDPGVIQVEATCTKAHPVEKWSEVHRLEPLRDVPRRVAGDTHHHPSAAHVTIECPSNLADEDGAFDLSLTQKTPDGEVGVRVGLRGKVGCFNEEGARQNARRRDTARRMVARRGEALRAVAALARCPASPPDLAAPAAALAPLEAQPGVVAASVGCHTSGAQRLYRAFGARRSAPASLDAAWEAFSSRDRQTYVDLGDQWVSVDTPFDPSSDLADTARIVLDDGKVVVGVIVSPESSP